MNFDDVLKTVECPLISIEWLRADAFKFVFDEKLHLLRKEEGGFLDDIEDPCEKLNSYLDEYIHFRVDIFNNPNKDLMVKNYIEISLILITECTYLCCSNLESSLISAKVARESIGLFYNALLNNSLSIVSFEYIQRYMEDIYQLESSNGKFYEYLSDAENMVVNFLINYHVGYTSINDIDLDVITIIKDTQFFADALSKQKK